MDESFDPEGDGRASIREPGPATMQVLGLVAAVNVASASGDIVGEAPIAAQVPAGARVHNRGWRSRWKLASAAPPAEA